MDYLAKTDMTKEELKIFLIASLKELEDTDLVNTIQVVGETVDWILDYIENECPHDNTTYEDYLDLHRAFIVKGTQDSDKTFVEIGLFFYHIIMSVWYLFSPDEKGLHRATNEAIAAGSMIVIFNEGK